MQTGCFRQAAALPSGSTRQVPASRWRRRGRYCPQRLATTHVGRTRREDHSPMKATWTSQARRHECRPQREDCFLLKVPRPSWTSQARRHGCLPPREDRFLPKVRQPSGTSRAPPHGCRWTRTGRSPRAEAAQAPPTEPSHRRCRWTRTGRSPPVAAPPWPSLASPPHHRCRWTQTDRPHHKRAEQRGAEPRPDAMSQAPRHPRARPPEAAAPRFGGAHSQPTARQAKAAPGAPRTGRPPAAARRRGEHWPGTRRAQHPRGREAWSGPPCQRGHPHLGPPPLAQVRFPGQGAQAPRRADAPNAQYLAPRRRPAVARGQPAHRADARREAAAAM